MKFAFAGIRSRCTELMAARAPGPIQTQKKPTAFGASAKHSKRKKLLTLASPNRSGIRRRLQEKVSRAARHSVRETSPERKKLSSYAL